MPLPAGSHNFSVGRIASHRSSTDPSSPKIQEQGIKDAVQKPLDGSRRTPSSEATAMPALSTASGQASINSTCAHAHIGQKPRLSSTRATSTLPSPSLTNEPSPGSTTAPELSLPVSVPVSVLTPALGSIRRQSTPLTITSSNARESLESDTQVETERLSMQPSVARGQREAEDDDVLITEHRQKKIRRDDGSILSNAQPLFQESLERCSRLLNHRMQTYNLLSNEASPIEKGRFVILRDACANDDLFYVVLHRFFCLWTLEPSRALAAFQINPALTDSAFTQLSLVMRNNKDMSHLHLAWLSHFPEYLSYFAGFGVVCLQISEFIEGFATRWRPLLDEIIKRRYPLLVWEARTQLKCQSPFLEQILFTLSRRSIGIHDGPLASELSGLFTADQKTEHELAEQNATPDQFKMAREAMANSYKGHINRAEYEKRVIGQIQSPSNPGSQLQPPALPLQTCPLPRQPSHSSQLPSPLQPPRPPPPQAQRLHHQQQQPIVVHQSPTNPSPTLPVMPQTFSVHQQPQSTVLMDPRMRGMYYGPSHPLSAQPNGSNLSGPVHSGFILQSSQSQPRRNSTPLSSNIGRTASVSGSVTYQQATTQLPNLRYSVSMTNTDRMPCSHQTMAEPYPQALQRQGTWPTAAVQPCISIASQDPQMLSTTSVSPAQTQAQSLAQIQSQTQSHVHVPVHHGAHLQSPQSVQYDVQAAHAQPSLPSFTNSTFRPSFTSPQAFQDPLNNTSLVAPIQQGPVLAPSTQSMPQMQQMQQVQPSQLEGEPQPCRQQFTTHVLNAHEYPNGVHDQTSLSCGLHLIYLRSPMRVPATLESTRYYQFLDKFPVSPRVIKPQTGITTLQFCLSDTPPNIPSCLTSKTGLPFSRYFNGCHRYRLRLCQKREIQTAMSETTWAISRSHWPSDIYISFNWQPQMLRRKQHFHIDLPIELTDSVTSGENIVQISLPNRPENVLPNTVYFVAVERIITLNDENVWSLVTNGQHISVAETKLVVNKRLKPSDSDDIVVANDTLMVSVVDPFSSQIFDVPVRGLECKHLECIDLKNWLETRPSKPAQSGREPTMVDVWNCPICGLDARPNSLRIDDFFVEVCQKLSEGGNRDVKKIQISADGTWVPVQESDHIKDTDRDLAKAEATQRSLTGPVPETIEIIDDDD